MRRLKLLAILLLSALLPACAVSGEVENQAYALVLGVEEPAGGGISLTIRIPRIGASGGDEGKSGTEPYLVISAEGENYPQALEHLQWAVARELNLSHLKLVVVSRELAESEAFPALIRAIAETRHLYTTAGFVVCEGSAGDFVRQQETILGTRLSSEITAMFRHYARHGYIARATLADLYYATLSGLSDPTGIWGALDGDEAPAAALIEDHSDNMKARTQTASARQYLGAAVFRDGRMAARLDARDTLYLNLLTARIDSFSYAFGGRDYTLSCVRRPRRRVRLTDGEPSLEAELWLTCEDDAYREELDALSADVARTLEDMIRRCQAMNIEPFGFADCAAAHFLTNEQWRRFNWRRRYPDAPVQVRVHITKS